jgi:hypothetical protein
MRERAGKQSDRKNPPIAEQVAQSAEDQREARLRQDEGDDDPLDLVRGQIRTRR